LKCGLAQILPVNTIELLDSQLAILEPPDPDENTLTLAIQLSSEAIVDCVARWLRTSHRKEGDPENAAYWYRRAGKPVCREPFDAEWRRIVSDLVGCELRDASEVARSD
jgi:hypothetical protein